MECSYVKVNHVINAHSYGRRSLMQLQEQLGYGTYCPSRFSALTLPHKNPSVSIIVFSTGNIIMMGSGSTWAALYALLRLKRKIGLEIVDIKLTNMVVKFDITGLRKRPVDVYNLYTWDQANCTCNMELFPSCTYAVPGTRMKANLFDSGKVVVTGATNDAEVALAVREVIDMVNRFVPQKRKRTRSAEP